MFRRAHSRLWASQLIGIPLLSAALVLTAGSGSALAQPSNDPVVPVEQEPTLAPAPPVAADEPPLPGAEETPALPPAEQLEVKMEITETDRDVRANDFARAAPSCMNNRWNSCYNGQANVLITDLSGEIVYGKWAFDVQFTM